jgi:hypothetical protein
MDHGTHQFTVPLKLVYPGNNYEAFFTVQDGTGAANRKAFTVYPARGPITGDQYMRLRVLNTDGVGCTHQFWVVQGKHVASPGPGYPSGTEPHKCNHPGCTIKHSDRDTVNFYNAQGNPVPNNIPLPSVP